MLDDLRIMTVPFRYAIDGVLFDLFADKSAVEALRDRYKGKPMLVVGNGPSLNKTPLEAFKDIPAIGMNKIDLLFERSEWRPTQIMVTNGMVTLQHWKQLAKLDAEIFLAWQVRFLVPGAARKRFGFFKVRADENFSTDAAQAGVGRGTTVAYQALQFAYLMGADPVILFGIDHSFVYKGKDLAYEKMEGDDPNHFDPRYFANQQWGAPDLAGNERGFLASKVAFEAAGRKIYDGTVGGKLEVFEKISVERAKELCGLKSE